jgi:hypothetical protein
MNLVWRGGLVAVACVAALSVGSVAQAQTGPQGQGLLELTPVFNMPLYFPAIGFDYSLNSNVSYNATTQLLTIDGTTTYLFQPNAPGNIQILGNLPQVGSPPPGNFGRASIRLNVNSQGVLANVNPHNACGDTTVADFCVTGYLVDGSGKTTVSNLLVGTVAAFQSSRNHPMWFNPGNGQSCVPLQQQPLTGDPGCKLFDFFEAQFHLTGGSLASKYYGSTSLLAVEVASPRADTYGNPIVYGCSDSLGNPIPGGCPVTNFNGFYSTNFLALEIAGAAGPTDNVAFANDPCNGTISGSVIGLDPTTLSGGVDLSLSGGYLGTSVKGTTYNGSFGFSGLCGAPGGLAYSVFTETPPGYTLTGSPAVPVSSTASVSMTLGPTGADTATPNPVNFTFTPVGTITSNFLTYGQGAWGARPKGQNAGYLLATYYVVPYGTSPVVVGGKYTVTMTGPVPVQNFLPQGGRPVPLDGNYVDPPVKPGHRKPHNKLGSLAGETLALRLNVDFSAFFLTRAGLGVLKVASGPLAGQTVNQVLAFGNCVLGGTSIAACGGANTLTYDAIEDTIERINKNYEGGTVDRHYLVQ